MNAVLLAAGVGKRLRPYTEAIPKCLVEVGDRTLLHRHLDILSSFPEIERVTMVVGYRQDQIRDAVATWVEAHPGALPVTFRTNDDYERGSIISLLTAREELTQGPVIAMDADVLYPRALMARLVHSDHPNCFLLDESTEETGEEMMVCVKGERALHIARSRDPSTKNGWDLKGEGVGFARIAGEDGPRLVEILSEHIARGNADAEYEVGLADFMRERVCGYERVGDLPWTEIDFSEDITRAEQVVLPAMAALA